MTQRPDPEAFAIDQFALRQESRSLLRVVVCGSVDHGKSTLIGRLLYESNRVFDDQLAALKLESQRYGTQGKDLDFALLLDGLAAEREQKITIDVAYRYFSTERRKFILADAPGHEQYTRNMATGASTADVALILVSAQAGLTRQTRRHSVIVSTLGVRRIALAVNKMDLCSWSQGRFDAIEREYRAFAADLGFDEIVCIPISARGGDNIVARSAHAPWHDGPTLFEYLENVEVATHAPSGLRMPVQWVNRPTPDFRGYSGLIASGEAYPGMAVRILPSGQTTRIDRIVTYDRDLAIAGAGQSVTLTLQDDVDVSRGDVIVADHSPPAVTGVLSARLFWMGSEPLKVGRRYGIKLATSRAAAIVEGPLQVVDLDTRSAVDAEALAENDLGACTLRLDRPLAADRYADNRETGSFILVDPESHDTVAMGFVDNPRPAAGGGRAWAGTLTRPWQAALSAWRKAGRERAATGRESHVRSVVKAISWRVTGSLDTFVVTLFITGSSVFASSVAATEVITKIVLYYLHERGWSVIPWGKA